MNAATKMVKHKIKNGDTLLSIAHNHHISLSQMIKLNGLKKGMVLKMGAIISVPVKYKVQRKNTRITLHKALRTYAKPFKKTKIAKRSAITLDDIFFKSSRPSLEAFHSLGLGSTKGKKIIFDAKKKLGRKYVWGAVGKKDTYDCSGFTSFVFKQNGIYIPRTSINQSKFGKFISRENLKKGDLIFFDTSRKKKGYVNHVGIYMGNGKFIHASSVKKKVVVSKLEEFYANRYRGARRLL